ncbi:MAG: TetR/AcrR family transcriptional regulator [Rufibacter sp.]
MVEKIISQAVEVLNRKGIAKSTLRDIARELNISDGHLRYYFKTKEELVLAIFSKMDLEIASFAEEGTTGTPTVQGMVMALTKGYEVMYRYVFFFTESTAILETFPKVYAAYQALIQNRRALFMAVFNHFQEQGIFTNEVATASLPVLFEQFFIISDNWTKYARLPQNDHLSQTEKVQRYVAVTMALLLPYFNAQLKEELNTWVHQAY